MSTDSPYRDRVIALEGRVAVLEAKVAELEKAKTTAIVPAEKEPERIYRKKRWFRADLVFRAKEICGRCTHADWSRTRKGSELMNPIGWEPKPNGLYATCMLEREKGVWVERHESVCPFFYPAAKYFTEER